VIDLDAFAAEVGTDDPVTICGAGTRGGAVPGVRTVTAPAGIDWLQADEMTVCCGAGTPVEVLDAALAEVGQRTVLPRTGNTVGGTVAGTVAGTVGGALSVGLSGVRRLGDGPVRDALLQARYVSATGEVVKAGGPTVKNVSGFDLCRLLVGSRGTLGFIGEVIVRTRPLPLHSQWFRIDADDPTLLFTALYRPVSMLWDGRQVWVLLEGHPRDIEHTAAQHRLEPCAAPAVPGARRAVVAPSEVYAAVRSLPTGSVVAEVGIGVVHLAAEVATALAPAVVAPEVLAVQHRVKQQFDPAGRLNPGVVPGVVPGGAR
jgi:glycolate oxidase FAD binding subunit